MKLHVMLGKAWGLIQDTQTQYQEKGVTQGQNIWLNLSKFLVQSQETPFILSIDSPNI